jgi:hypothetical protein
MATKNRGIGNVDYIRQGSEVTVADQPNWSFLYQASTNKPSQYNVGDRQVTPDGRVFRLALAGGTCDPEFGAYQPLKCSTVAVLPAQAVINGPVINQFGANASTTAGAVGSNVITVTIASGDGPLGTGAIALDELRGGYIIYNHGANQHPQFRGIIGNDAVAAGGGACNVYLDAAITPIVISGTTYQAVVVGTTTAEVMCNPFQGLKGDGAGGGYVTFLGMPAARATVGQYFWLQTWGPVWATSNSITAAGAHDREVYFVDNGSLQSRTSAGAAVYQLAGLVMDASSAGASNSPFVMLQIAV